MRLLLLWSPWASCVAVLVLLHLTAGASLVQIASQNKSCLLPSPTSFPWWIASSVVAIGNNFLVSIDGYNSTENSWLFLLNPSSCKILSKLQLPLRCSSALTNTQLPTMAAASCYSLEPRSMGINYALFAVSVTGNSISLANSTKITAGSHGGLSLVSNAYPIQDSIGRLYLWLGNDGGTQYVVTRYDAPSNTLVLLCNYTGAISFHTLHLMFAQDFIPRLRPVCLVCPLRPIHTCLRSTIGATRRTPIQFTIRRMEPKSVNSQ